MKEQILLQYIPHGSENAISMNELAVLTQTSARAVRKLVFEARAAGIPILSGNCGYWLAEEEAGAEDIAFLRRREAAARSTFRSLKTFRERIKKGGGDFGDK